MFNTGTNAGNFTWAKYNTTDSANTNNVVGPAGYGNVNYANSIFSWGPGCVGGGDLRVGLIERDAVVAVVDPRQDLPG